MIKNICLLVSLVILSSLVVGTIGCSSDKSTMEVVVSDASGIPLIGASVSFINQPEGQAKLTGVSGQDSRVIFKDIKAGAYRVSVAMQSYDTFFVECTIGKGHAFTAKVYLNRATIQSDDTMSTLPLEGE